jgi:hypothetical protein
VDWRRLAQKRGQLAASSPLPDLPIRQVMGDAHYLPESTLPEVSGRKDLVGCKIKALVST